MAAELVIQPLDLSIARYVLVAPALESYAVTITNISSEPLRGASVEFSGHSNYIRWNAEPLNARNGSRRVLEVLRHQGPGADERPKCPTLARRITLSSILAELDSSPITVAVNWVADQIGRMIGPDPHNDFVRLAAQRQARQQLAAELAAAADPKTVLEAARETRPGPSRGLYDRDFYNEQRKRDGRKLSALTNAGSITAIPNFISRALREMPLTK
jgi:hypothetical protein